MTNGVWTGTVDLYGEGAAHISGESRPGYSLCGRYLSGPGDPSLVNCGTCLKIAKWKSPDQVYQEHEHGPLRHQHFMVEGEAHDHR